MSCRPRHNVGGTQFLYESKTNILHDEINIWKSFVLVYCRKKYEIALWMSLFCIYSSGLYSVLLFCWPVQNKVWGHDSYTVYKFHSACGKVITYPCIHKWSPCEHIPQQSMPYIPDFGWDVLISDAFKLKEFGLYFVNASPNQQYLPILISDSANYLQGPDSI